MSEVQSPELNNTRVNKFNIQLRDRYGDKFLQSYRTSTAINLSALDIKPLDLPYLSELKKILENAHSLRFIEWKNDEGVIDWRYIVVTTEDRPADEGKYTCHKVFSYDGDSKRWIQEVAHIEAKDSLPMHDRVTKAVKGSLSSAFQDRLGFKFRMKYSQSGYVKMEETNRLPFGRELQKLLPKRGKVRIKYFEEPKLTIPKLAKSAEETSLIEAYGANFYQNYIHAKLYRIENVSAQDKSQLPQYNQFEKNVVGGRKYFTFKYVEWIDKEGGVNFAYVLKWWSKREGKKRYYYQVVEPHVDERGKADLISTYLPFNPNPLDEKPIGERKEPCYVVEQKRDGQVLIQVLRPSVEEKGGFEIVFIGVIDEKTKKCLVFNNIFPEVTFIQTSDKKKTGIGGMITISPNPVCYLSRLDSFVHSNFAHQILTSAMNPSIVIGHELGHHEDFQRVMQKGERAYQKYLPSLGEYLYILTLPTLVKTTLSSAPLALSGNPTPFITGLLVVAGNTIFGNAFFDRELIADENIKILVQSARENGVELVNGMPDNLLPTVTRMMFVRITIIEMYKILKKPKLPLK